MNVKELTSALQRSLLAREEILAIYLFGSHTEGCARSESDLDIAILLQSDFKPSPDYRLNLLEELSDLFPYRLDLIILNQVPPVIQFQVLQKGQVLIDRDPSKRAELVMHMLNRVWEERHRGWASPSVRRRETASEQLRGRSFPRRVFKDALYFRI